MSKLWGGRFEQESDKLAESFNSSISFDSRMAAEDVTGSIAHASMLGRQGIIPQEDADKIVEGLKAILADMLEGKITFSVEDEDIHMNVERLLTARIGAVGKRLHTGRSRNDQVALDIRMYMKKVLRLTMAELKTLCEALVCIAKDNLKTIIPAYTHLQKAQPSTLAHYVMAYCEMFSRDIGRLSDCYKRTDAMPLGSGALCATTYPLDRDSVAAELGFSSITKNSLDAVSDRDFLLEYLSAASICMMHLSRFCEELILFSTNEFGVLQISDAYATGSSIMPQKKNPDMAELIRGKTGRVYGALVGLLTVMKGLPLAYNKDMQEDKEGVFDAADTLIACLQVFTGMVNSMEFNKEKLFDSAGLGFTNATDAADYLVKKGMPFRDAHEVIGKIVLHCEKHGYAIADIPHLQLLEFSELFEEDVYDSISLKACVKARNIPGGPAPESVKKHIADMKKFLKTIK
jgi:argininosuccinate lyase